MILFMPIQETDPVRAPNESDRMIRFFDAKLAKPIEGFEGGGGVRCFYYCDGEPNIVALARVRARRDVWMKLIEDFGIPHEDWDFVKPAEIDDVQAHARKLA